MRAEFAELDFDRLTERELDVLRRLAAGSSDEAIARELYLSVNTIKWHNRNIYSKLGVDSRTQALVVALETGLLQEKPTARGPETGSLASNLPAPISSFLGRERELQEVLDLLKNTRLLTVTGTAGVGKTRLALQAASILRSAGDFLDGVYWVELASVEEPDKVGEALVTGLGLRSRLESEPLDLLAAFLAGKQLLLLADNFEHLLPAAVLVHDLLSAAPGLKILATSREALHLSGELVFRLDPMMLPDLKKTDLPVKRVESVDLFLQRSRAARSGLAIPERDHALIGQICARLDGLPLALELAAARMDFFRPRDLLAQLDDRFVVLVGGARESPERHHTLQKAIDWSYQLLTVEEQTLFNRLSVFRGGRTIDAVEQVCCPDLSLSALDGLGSLYSKNLLRHEDGLDGELRFTLLESLHAFARDRLEESGEEPIVKDRHALYFTELAERAHRHIRGGAEQFYWIKRLRSDHANLRKAFEWAVCGEGEDLLGLRLVGCLDPYWEFAGVGREIQTWVGSALEISEDAPPGIRGKVLSIAGTLYFYAMEYRLSFQLYQEALKLFQKVGDREQTAWSLALLISLSEENPARYPQVPEYYTLAQEIFRDEGNLAGLAYLQLIYGKHLEKAGDLLAAKTAYRSALEIGRKIGDQYRVCVSLLQLGSIAYWEGDYQASQELIQESLRVEVGLDYLPIYTVGTLIALSFPVGALGFPRRAAVLLSAGSVKMFELGFNARPQTKAFIEQGKTDLLEQLGSRIFQQAWDQGAAMDPREAIAYALEEIPDP